MNQLAIANTARQLPAEEQLSSEAGRRILERIRIAMSNATLEKVDPKRIRPMKEQPRNYFNDPRLQKLSQSIKESGQMMPGIVRRVKLDNLHRDFELCDGERRLRAVLLGGIVYYRALVIDIDDEAAQYVVSIIANFNREGHTTLEIVDSIVKMHDQLKLTMREIAEVIGLGPMTVQNMYGLRRLKPEVRDMLDPHLVKGRTLPVQAAIEISRLPEEHQHALALRIMHGAVQARLVRKEIVAISQKHGLAVARTYKHRSASSQNRSVLKRIETILEASEGLRQVLSEPTAEKGLQALPIPDLERLVKSLEATAKQFVATYEQLNGVLVSRQGRLIKK